MELTYVDSKSVDQIGYDEDQREVHVIFKRGGAHYIYSDVSEEVWLALSNASSKGIFVNDEFIKKKYQCRKA